MKIESFNRPGLIALGVVGLAATALLGVAAATVIARNPEVLRRAARTVARGIERASLLTAQASEHLGDVWAEAREEARAEVDAADFEHAAAAAATAAPAAAAAAAPKRAPRKAAPKRPAKPRTTRKPKATAAHDAAQSAVDATS